MKSSHLKRELSVQTRLQVRFERALRKQLTSEFNKAAKQYSVAFSNNDDLKTIIKRHRQRLIGVLTPALYVTMTAFSERLDGKSSYLGLETKRQGSVFELLIQRWLFDHVSILADRLSETSLNIVTRVIRDGEVSEIHPTETARRIVKKTGGKVGRIRAQRIARTEVHSAAGYSGLKTAELSGLDLDKVWASAEDTRTRISHSLAHGQKQKLNEYFIIGGEKARYPGDPKLSAKQRINCRCISLYVPKDDR